VFLGALAVFFAQRWFAWQREPRAYGGTANALWARHQWVGERHTEADYRARGHAEADGITDVFFHVGPLDGDGRMRSYVRPADRALRVPSYALTCHDGSLNGSCGGATSGAAASLAMDLAPGVATGGRTADSAARTSSCHDLVTSLANCLDHGAPCHGLARVQDHVRVGGRFRAVKPPPPGEQMREPLRWSPRMAV
jgi:hypothetical protein